MACNNTNNVTPQKKCHETKCKCIEICGMNYRIELVENGDCLTCFATPCSLPSAVFEVARICERQNSCTQFEYYVSEIFTDPVEIIIDCDLCAIIRRSVETYVNNINLNGCKNQNGFFGLF